MNKIKTFTYGSHFYAVCIVTDNRKVIVKYYSFAGEESNEITEFPKDESTIGFAALNKLYYQIKVWSAERGLLIINKIG